jgi:hypothetical protein
MRKKNACLLCVSTTLLIAGAVLGGGLALKHEPHFYRRGQLDPSPERKQLSMKFVNSFVQLMLNFKNDRDDGHYHFTEDEINSFFQEDFVSYGEAENLRKVGVSEPRVALEEDRIRFAFRYGSGIWSTVLTYDLKVWIVPKEPNVLAVEILGRRAGAIPISPQGLLNEVTELAARHNVEVTAYRHEGHPVALIRFQADRPRAGAHLKGIRARLGELRLLGSTAECPKNAKDRKDAPASN